MPQSRGLPATGARVTVSSRFVHSGRLMSEHANRYSGDGQARGMADAVARRSYGELVALLAARTGDLAAAEDALSEALVSALVNWPLNGCPSNPKAWLLSVARRKVIDLSRRRRTHEIAVGQVPLRAEWRHQQERGSRGLFSMRPRSGCAPCNAAG